MVEFNFNKVAKGKNVIICNTRDQIKNFLTWLKDVDIEKHYKSIWRRDVFAYNLPVCFRICNKTKIGGVSQVIDAPDYYKADGYDVREYEYFLKSNNEKRKKRVKHFNNQIEKCDKDDKNNQLIENIKILLKNKKFEKIIKAVVESFDKKV